MNCFPGSARLYFAVYWWIIFTLSLLSIRHSEYPVVLFAIPTMIFL